MVTWRVWLGGDVAQLAEEDGEERFTNALLFSSVLFRALMVRGAARFSGEANFFPMLSWGVF